MKTNERLSRTNKMTFSEFEKKYNKRDYRGVVLECSIINLDGDIIFRGKIDDVDRYFDDNADFIWEGDVLHRRINGQDIIMTNLANYSWYQAPEFKKLHFEVELDK